MATETTNFGLTKDASTDYYNIDTTNTNLDIIDEEIKKAQIKAEQAFTQANDGKERIADVVGAPAASSDTFAQLKEKIQSAKTTIAANLSTKGVVAQATEALAALAGKIANIVRGSGNAQPSDVLKDKTFSNDDGPGQVGTMPNNGPSAAETITLTTQNQEYAIAKGYHSGLRKIKAAISGLVASVIKAGTTVGGILGTFTADATALASDILSGKTAYKNGSKITGSMANNGFQTSTLTISGSSKPTKSIPSGYTSGGTVTAQLSSSLANKILQGTTIAGVAGTAVDGTNRKRWASGTSTPGYNSGLNKTGITVTGLTFKPTVIILYLPGPALSVFAIYVGGLQSGSTSSGRQSAEITPTNDGFTSHTSSGGFYSKFSEDISWYAFE